MTSATKVVLIALLAALLASGGTAAAVPGAGPTTGPTTGPATGHGTSEPVAAAGPAKAERKVVALTNKRRKAHGCGPLVLRKTLRKAARRHTVRMAEAGQLEHQLPGEPDLGRRVTNAGYTGWTMLAENIAYGYPTPRAVVRGWMGSQGHRANILNCRLNHIGVGLVRAHGVAWWTQVFGRK